MLLFRNYYGFNVDILPGFFDHAMRQHPSESMVSIKRNFYSHDVPIVRLMGEYLEVIKGTYSAMRLSDVSRTIPEHVT